MLFWNDPHHVCFSGMTLIMHAFLERPSSCMLFWNDSSCMLFWNDPHHECLSGKTLIMYAFLERHSSCMLFWNDPHHEFQKSIQDESFQKSIHDEGLSRKACMMRVIPEKHT
jgi:hypothetical protein